MIRAWTKDDYGTPPWLCKALAAHYGEVTLDPCWNGNSEVHPRAGICLTRDVVTGWRSDSQGGTTDVLIGDGLARGWDLAAADASPGLLISERLIFVNPPYSDPGAWLDKARDCLTPILVLINLDSTIPFRAMLSAGARLGLFNKRLAFLKEDGKPKTGYDRSSCLLALNHHARGDLLHPDIAWFRGTGARWT